MSTASSPSLVSSTLHSPTRSRDSSPSPTLSPPTSFILPDLVSHCNFPLTYHPNGDEEAAKSLQWMLSYVPHFTPKKIAAMNGLQAGELTAYCYHDCPPERLRVVDDFMNYLFHLDNISDGMMAKNTGLLADWVMNAFEWPETYKPPKILDGEVVEEIAAAKLARDYWSRCIKEAKPGVQQRFKSSMNMFFQAVYQQATDRGGDVVPDLESYIDMRRDTSGCKPVFDLIEYALGFELPEEVVTHPVIKALNQGANDLVTWSNDIFSYNVEQSRGDTHNMICIFMEHDGLTLQESIDHVGALCKQTIDAFVENQARVPSFADVVDPSISSEVDAWVKGYVQGLQDWIVGSLHWSFMTKRYFQDRGAEVKKTRYVKLLPMENRAPKAVVA